MAIPFNILKIYNQNSVFQLVCQHNSRVKSALDSLLSIRYQRKRCRGNGAGRNGEKWCREKWGETVPEMVPGLESEMAEMVRKWGKWCRVLNCESICSPEMGT